MVSLRLVPILGRENMEDNRKSTSVTLGPVFIRLTCYGFLAGQLGSRRGLWKQGNGSKMERRVAKKSTRPGEVCKYQHGHTVNESGRRSVAEDLHWRTRSSSAVALEGLAHVGGGIQGCCWSWILILPAGKLEFVHMHLGLVRLSLRVAD